MCIIMTFHQCVKFYEYQCMFNCIHVKFNLENAFANTMSCLHSGFVRYDIAHGGSSEVDPQTHVDILSQDGEHVARASGLSGSFQIPNVTLWWPYSMSKHQFGHMYTLMVRCSEIVERQSVL